MAIAVHSHQQQLDVQCIDTPTNVRELDTEHVNALAVSIALQGVLVPIVVRDAGDGRYQLAAGFHRFAAVKQLGAAVIDQVPVVVRDAEHEDADRAVENITSCRRRHDVINADRDGMPTDRRAGSDAGRACDARSA
jgi:ParB/RepB/Spo0J family partition protein